MQVEIGPGQSCVADGSFGRQELGCAVWLATLDNKKVLRRRRNSLSFLIAAVIQPDTFLCQSFPWVTSFATAFLIMDFQKFRCVFSAIFKVFPFSVFMPLLSCLRMSPSVLYQVKKIAFFLLVFKGKSFRVQLFRVQFWTIPSTTALGTWTITLTGWASMFAKGE